MVEEPTFSIGDLASEFGVTTRTIRHYEDEGMIRPRRRGTQRLYGPRDRVRLKLILRGRRIGFSLREIREIVDLYDAEPGEAGQLRFLLSKIAARRAELQAKQRDLEAALADLAGVEANCLAHLSSLSGQTESGEEGR